MFANWVVGITLIATSNFGRVASQASAQASAASKSVSGLKANMGGIAAVGKIVDRTMIGLGIASAATFAIGIKGAAAMQDQMNQLAITTGRPVAEMEKYHDIALQMSLRTAQSISDSLGLIRTMASLGVKSENLPTLAMPIALFADTQFLGQHKTPFEESVKAAVRLSHDMQIYDAEGMTRALQTFARASTVMGHSVPEAMQQIKYFAPKFYQAGISPEDTINFYALLDRVGLGSGRGGTGINMLMKNLMSPRGAKKSAALEAMGIYDARGQSPFIDEATGAVHFEDFLKYVANWRDRMKLTKKGALSERLVNMGFDTNAAMVLDTIATSKSMELLRGIRTQEGKMPDLGGMQSILMSGLNPQLRLLASNFNSLATELAKPWLNDLTNLVSALASATGKVAVWAHDHPTESKVISGVMLGLTGYAFARFAMRMNDALRGFMVLGKFGPRIGVSESMFPHHIGAVSEAREAARAGWLKNLLFGGRDVAAVAASRAAGVAVAAETGGGLIGALFGFRATRALLGPVVRSVSSAAGLGSFFGGLIRPIAGVARAAGIGSFLEGLSPIKLVGEVLAKVGLRVIPVVGEVLLLVDAFNFLRTHMGNIGYIVGVVGVWLADNLPGVIRGAAGLAVLAMRGLVFSIIDVLNPVNWAHALLDFKKGVQDAVQDAHAKHIVGYRPQTVQPTAFTTLDRPLAQQLPAPRDVGPTIHRLEINVTANTKKEGEAAGSAAGGAFVSALRQQGLLRTTPLGAGVGGNAVPAAH